MGPFLVLTTQVSIDFSLVCEIVRDSAVHVFQPEEFAMMADRLRRFAAAKGVDNGVERDPSTGNIIVIAPLLYVFLCHILHLTVFVQAVKGTIFARSHIRSRTRMPRGETIS